MFIDKVKIFVKAGKGGKGCQSFYRDKLMRPPKRFKHWKGRPDGGDGGKGGCVIFKANAGLYSLLGFKYRKHFFAEDGKHGGSNNKRGQNGKDNVIGVPVGTIIRNFDNRYLLADLNENSEQLTVAKGGLGGLGNFHIQAAAQGENGEELTLELELKLISDFAIVGFPNVGKSSLICCISNCKSKVADFAFTTKSPVLGVVDLGDVKCVVADMPGLIKDAHKGRGLGLEFLRHIKRAKAILHVLDMSGREARDPLQDYIVLNKELEFYDKDLLKKPELIVANKMDLIGAEENLKIFLNQVDKEVIPVSALKKQGINELLAQMQKMVKYI